MGGTSISIRGLRPTSITGIMEYWNFGKMGHGILEHLANGNDGL
jgi:hypothetical protein